jgi:hypothetical protein
MSFGLNQNFKQTKKRKTSKKKKHIKTGTHEVGGSIKIKKKGLHSE